MNENKIKVQKQFFPIKFEVTLETIEDLYELWNRMNISPQDIQQLNMLIRKIPDHGLTYPMPVSRPRKTVSDRWWPIINEIVEDFNK